MNLAHYRQYQTFTSVKELDLHVRAFLKCHKPELSEGNMEVLRFVWRHSVKYPGVSFAKIATIVKQTGKSRSTVIRTINRLEEMGLLKRVETLKPNGKRGVNVLIFQPFEGGPWHEGGVTGDQVEHSTEVSIHTEEKKQDVSENEQPSAVIDASFLPSYISSDFITAAKPFLSPEELECAWRSIRIAFQKAHLKQGIEEYIDLITLTFRQSVYAWKTGKVKKSLLGYFYGGLRNVFMQQVRREVMASPETLYYDWLNGS